jgi:hypothetical protein
VSEDVATIRASLAGHRIRPAIAERRSRFGTSGLGNNSRQRRVRRTTGGDGMYYGIGLGTILVIVLLIILLT